MNLYLQHVHCSETDMWYHSTNYLSIIRLTLSVRSVCRTLFVGCLLSFDLCT